MMKFPRKILAIAAFIGISSLVTAPAGAVTKDEMDRARAVTAQWYLRWVNNGSDYLDNLNPKSMADLESHLKEKEKENIKAFKNAGMPSDYASWDKDKVVEYWSATFFQSKGLAESGKGAKARVKKKLLALNFTDPADMPKETPAEETPEIPATAAPTDTAKKAETPAALPSAEEIIDQTNAEESAMTSDAVEETPAAKKESGSGTWLYVVALIVLIGVVVWLVIFASKTMQNSAKASKDLEDEEEEHLEEARSARRSRRSTPRQEEIEEEIVAPVVYHGGSSSYSGADEEVLREKFARKLAVKDEEIHDLRREISELRNENLRLSEDNGRLASELKIARREVESAAPRTAVVAAPSAAEESSRSRRAPGAREIYLGRVNSKGLFVRADRKPVEGKSVFVLTTTDSYTGTFRVLQAGATVDMALDNPDYYLSGGCVAPDINDTAEADGIRTVSSGTAVFEDGCWKVLRKAKIAYE